MGATVPFTLYQRLFAKPLMLIGMENALILIEQKPSLRDLSKGGAARPIQSKTETYPETDKTSLGQTLAVVGFHRKFMKHVFTSDELAMYLKYKQEARVMRRR